jgi:hypothetical protein
MDLHKFLTPKLEAEGMLNQKPILESIGNLGNLRLFYILNKPVYANINRLIIDFLRSQNPVLQVIQESLILDGYLYARNNLLPNGSAHYDLQYIDLGFHTKQTYRRLMQYEQYLKREGIEHWSVTLL